MSLLDGRFCCRPFAFLSFALVVWDALRLGSAGVLAGEGKDYKRDEVGEHAVEVDADAEVGKQEHAVAVDVYARVAGADALEQAEEQIDAPNLPYTTLRRASPDGVSLQPE